NQFEILYHFSFDKEDVMVSLRVRLTRDNPEAPSLSGLIKGAAWIEREMHELFGINFVGHPGLKRLLLPEDWPEKVYPLRKEFFMTEKKEG
ncbi:MAG TPA: NADH-quinone oxidoreductase subunit C, partial [bacterium]|nr:NADH-quinone oxidoreductase subunit C [bacterium]